MMKKSKSVKEDINEVLELFLDYFKNSPLIVEDLLPPVKVFEKYSTEPYEWTSRRICGKLKCDTDEPPKICLNIERDYVYGRYIPKGISLTIEQFNYFTEKWKRLLECYIGLKETGEWVRGCGNTLGFESYVKFDERRFNLLTPRGRKVLEAVCGVVNDFLDLTENVKPHTPRCFPRLYDGHHTEEFD